MFMTLFNFLSQRLTMKEELIPLRTRFRDWRNVWLNDFVEQFWSFSYNANLLYCVLQQSGKCLSLTSDRALRVLQTLRMWTSVAGQITLILTSLRSVSSMKWPKNHVYCILLVFSQERTPGGNVPTYNISALL
jgi:hypothetical protein